MADPQSNGIGNPKRVAVFRALQLGDMLCAVPALRALRAHLPDAHVTLVGLPWAAEFAERFARYVDDFLPFPGAPGLPEREPAPGELDAFYVEARARRFDLALQLHGSGATSNPVVTQMGATQMAGFFPADGHCPDPARYLAYPEDLPEAERLLRLLAHLGVAEQSRSLEFPLWPSDRQKIAPILREHGLQKDRYVCLHPGSRAAARRWPALRFAVVGDVLAAYGLRVVLTGSGAERGLTANVRKAMLAPVAELSGATDLGAFAALLQGARVVICNDTGASHLADALGVPSVVIFTGSDPSRWAPEDRKRHRAVYHPVDCRPCSYDECPIGHPCAAAVGPHSVLEQAFGLLNQYYSLEVSCDPYAF